MENQTEPEATDPAQKPLPFDERKEHYESLISLFKVAIGSLTFVISVAGGFIGFTVYSDGKEMRAAMREQEAAIQEHLRELNIRELEMQKSLLDLVKTTRDDVSLTGQRAINQISSIREESTIVARMEAKKRIEQVFEENKIEDFIVEVAKEKLEPEVKRVVSENISSLNNEKLMKALSDLSSGDESKQERADLFFQNTDHSDWSEEQLEKIVETLKKMDGGDFHKINASIYLSYTRSPVLEDYFKTELIKSPDIATGSVAFEYLTKGLSNDLPAYFVDAFRKSEIKNRSKFYNRLIQVSVNAKNNRLLTHLLNHKELIDIFYTDMKESGNLNLFESCKVNISNIIQAYNFPVNLESTYLLTKQ